VRLTRPQPRQLILEPLEPLDQVRDDRGVDEVHAQVGVQPDDPRSRAAPPPIAMLAG
jgi:hypothetical protein